MSNHDKATSTRTRKLESVRRWGGVTRWVGAALLVLATTALAGCDFDVTNPGPVQDRFLNDPGAYQALNNGVQRRMNRALNGIMADVGVRTREVINADANPWEGWSNEAFMGTFVPRQESNFYEPWENSAEARWQADDNIRRVKEALGDAYSSNGSAGRANLWSGFAHRLVAEYSCDLIIDGAAPQPQSEAFKRAEERFTSAIQIASAAGDAETVTAAHAGRASVRINLGDWSGAVADAGEVDTDFVFQLRYDAKQNWRFHNVFAFADQVEGGIVTVFNTPYKEYVEETGDPRTPWIDTGKTVVTSFPLDVNEIPLWTPQKFVNTGDDVDLVTGTEMRLVEAEALLMDGQIDPAMAILNSLRTRVGIEPWPEPADLDEAWNFFRRERGVELWLEGRRLADYARWERNDAPGSRSPEELGTTRGGPDLSNMPLCSPPSDEEVAANENLG